MSMAESTRDGCQGPEVDLCQPLPNKHCTASRNERELNAGIELDLMEQPMQYAEYNLRRICLPRTSVKKAASV